MWGLTLAVLSEALVLKQSDKARPYFYLLLPRCYPLLVAWVQFLL